MYSNKEKNRQVFQYGVSKAWLWMILTFFKDPLDVHVVRFGKFWLRIDDERNTEQYISDK